MMEAAERLSQALADRYRLERELGAGGMATVYLAQDLKHDRKVALKVLKPELAAVLGAERFVVEIKTTAALQHPHILPLFDSGAADGFLYYVMPYLQGETLRDKLNRETQLGIEEAVRLTTEVADALDYAHRHGVIHRDIKPENILLHDGRPMVADFGIALAVSAAAGGRMTETGMSLGTPHYMSPEQATAEKKITGRSDVYSLGSVLYEMLTGEPPHMGNSAQAIIMKIVTEDAQPVTRLRKSVPPNVTAAVAKALEKLPADRFSSAASFAEALVTPGYTTPSHTRAGAAALPRKVDRRLLAATVGLVLMTALAVWGLLRSPAPAPVLRYGLAIPAASRPDVGSLVAIAPDGSALAYTGPSGTPLIGQVWLKPRASDRPAPLPGTLGAVTVTFSPDGAWVAFVTPGSTGGGTLKKVQVAGGAAISLADSAAPASAPAWLDDGTIVYAQRGGRGLRRVADGGGPSQQVWPADSGLVREVTALPGSAGVLISRCPANTSVCASRDIWVLDLRSGTARLVVADGLTARYLPTGHVLYVRPDGAGLVIPFDLRGLAPHGSPIAV
ncbi:MAG TPA: serine/threonine-protein kinase, partial [Methylomirabilota bacterium]